MKTKIFLLVMLFVFTLSVNAQQKEEKPFKFGAGAMLGLPLGKLSDIASLAYGVDLLGEYAISSQFALTLSAGYIDWAKKSGVTGNWGLIPVLAGAKYYFSDQIYGSFQAGISFWADGTKSELAFAPGVGYKISDKLDLLLKFHYQSNSSWKTSILGLRVGYSF